MNALISKMLLMSLVLLSFSGCVEKELVYVDRVVIEKVPQKCVVPVVHCEFTGTYTERVRKVEICITNFNTAIKVCR